MNHPIPKCGSIDSVGNQPLVCRRQRNGRARGPAPIQQRERSLIRRNQFLLHSRFLTPRHSDQGSSPYSTPPRSPHKRLFRVVRRINLCDCPQLGMRTENKIDARTGPLDLAGRPIAPLIHAFGQCGFPLRVHIQQVDEEIVRQRLGPVGEDATLGLPEIRIQCAHAAD